LLLQLHEDSAADDSQQQLTALARTKTMAMEQLTADAAALGLSFNDN
jgi:hypothetical protein